MITLNKAFALYENGDESLYDELTIENIYKLETACDQNLAKYYEFQQWLYSIEHYYTGLTREV